MTKKKMPAPRRAGTRQQQRTEEFTRLLFELAALNPQALHEFGEEMRQETRPVTRRSRFPNKVR